MAKKSYTVRFANTNIGASQERNQQLRDVLDATVTRRGRDGQRGHHLSTVAMEGEHFQVRNLVRVGRFWRGAFARLREEAPHVIGRADVEREITLEDGERVLEKSYFLYYEDTDILVFQMSRNVGYLSRFAIYWSRLLDGLYVDFPPAVNVSRLEEILQTGVREVNFTYARAPGALEHGPRWTQRAMEMLRPVHGAVGKFTLRAPRGEILGGHIGDLVRWAASGGDVRRAKVLLQDERDPIDLFIEPIKVRIDVELNGRYPDERSAIEQMGEAYSTQAPHLPMRPPRNDRG
jgi:hypothetical protein